MPLQTTDAMLLILLAGAVGLGAGWGISTWVSRRQATSVAPEAAARPEGNAAVPQTPATPVPAPAKRPPELPTPRPAASLLPPAADLLLVDDSAVARAKLRRMFEGAGYAVHLANDGIEALALLEKGQYALLITDLEMPNMDGVTLINTCLGRPQTAGMPILAISGHESLRAKFNECRDVCGIHRKPWVDDILLSHVATLVGPGARRSKTQAAQPAGH